MRTSCRFIPVSVVLSAVCLSLFGCSGGGGGGGGGDDGNATAGATTYAASCAECHGEGEASNLAGMSAAELEAGLGAAHTGGTAEALGITEDDYGNLGAYLESEVGNDNGAVSFTPCDTEGNEDDGIDFSGFGETKVVLSTIGEGRHVVLDEGVQMVYEFDQPVPHCAVVPENVTLTDLDTGTAVPLAEADLTRQNITNADGVVIASRVFITLPIAQMTAGHDFELVLDDEGLGLDGEFQENAETSAAANGTLPSGNGTAGGDFVQLFRAVSVFSHLTDTNEGAAMALDAADRLFIVGNNALYGPFTSSGQVTEGSRLAPDLNQLANGVIAVNNDSNVIIKDGSSDGRVYEVDPDTGTATLLAVAALNSYPKSLAVAPTGYASVETAGVEAGDLVFSDDSGVSVLDVAGGGGRKGGLNLVDRTNEINSAFMKLFVPPARTGKPRELYAAYRPEEETGFEIARILPNGVMDHSVFLNPSGLIGVDGTSALQLQDTQGREEFVIIGTINTALAETRQLLPTDLDGKCIMIYDKTRNRLQVLAPLPIDEFAFTFGPYSDLAITSDLDTLYCSLPSLSRVLGFSGFANDDASGSPACDSGFDEGIDFGNEGAAQVVAGTLGNGRHLLRNSPTVVEFQLDLPVRWCNVTPENVRLTDAGGGAISLDDRDVRRVNTLDAVGAVTASKIVVDLPSSLTTGSSYQITLDGDGLGLDGDFVQAFQLIQGDIYLRDTPNATGIALDADGRLFAASEDYVLGPFTGATAVSTVNVLSDDVIVSGGGRPIGVDDMGMVIFVGRNDGKTYAINPDTGVRTQLVAGASGSYEIDVAFAPTGYAGTANAGDLIIFNEGRAIIPDVTDGSGYVTWFSDSNISNEFVNFFVTPAPLFAEAICGVYVLDGTQTTIYQVTADGDLLDNVFPAALAGMAAHMGIRLQDYQGDAEYLLIGDFSESAADLLTPQTRTGGSGMEMVVYNPARQTLQVVGILSRSLEASPGYTKAAVTFPDDLETVYVSQPVARTVIRFTGMGNE